MTDATGTLHLGLDLGGTNIKWAVLVRDGDAWSTVGTGSAATCADEGEAAVVARLADTAHAAMAAHGSVASVGVGVPGLYDPDGGTTEFLVNFPGGWRGVRIVAPLTTALALPIALINDARAFGLAELRLGAARGVDTMIGLTLGTGVGGVVAVHGMVLQGYKGRAGELGHQTIDPDGPWCNCGNRGCVEAFCRADQIALACGTRSVEEAVSAARAGDPRAIQGLSDTGRYLGIGLANMIVALNPDRVVLGGGVAAAGDLILSPIRDEIARRVHVTAYTHIDVVVASLGTYAGAIGAGIHGAEDATARAAAGS
ncbi:MAG: ROK family protein [Candidatus Limnocylindrales bacterium]